MREQQPEVRDVLGEKRLAVVGGDGRLHPCTYVVERRHVDWLQNLCGETCGDRLEQHPARIEIADVVARDLGDDCADPWHELDEPLGREQPQRLADGRAADTRELGQPLLRHLSLQAESAELCAERAQDDRTRLGLSGS